MKAFKLVPIAFIVSSATYATEAKKITCEVNHHYSFVITEKLGTKELVITTKTSANESERPTLYYSLPATDKITLQDIGDALKNGEPTVLHALKVDKDSGRPVYEAKVLSIYIANGPQATTYILENSPNVVSNCNIDDVKVELTKPQ